MQTRLYLTPWTLLRINLFSSSVISNKIHNYNFNKIKAFIISLTIHITLFVILLYSSTQIVRIEPLKEEKKVMSVSLVSSFEKSLPKKITPQPAPVKPVVKKVLAKKPLLKKPTITKKIAPKPIIKKSPKKAAPQPKVAPIPEKMAPTTQPAELFTPLATKQAVTNKVEKDSLNPEPPLQEKGVSPTELGKIRSLIQNSLVYPAIARRMKIEGVVVVAFLLSKDGHVERANVVVPSGSRTLDAKALKTVLALSGEYPHLKKKTDLQIPISFSLKNS